ncbi:MAG: hypothetical protein ACI31I_04800 [Bacilli bacterium]
MGQQYNLSASILERKNGEPNDLQDSNIVYYVSLDLNMDNISFLQPREKDNYDVVLGKYNDYGELEIIWADVKTKLQELIEKIKADIATERNSNEDPILISIQCLYRSEYQLIKSYKYQLKDVKIRCLFDLYIFQDLNFDIFNKKFIDYQKQQYMTYSSSYNMKEYIKPIVETLVNYQKEINKNRSKEQQKEFIYQIYNNILKEYPEIEYKQVPEIVKKSNVAYELYYEILVTDFMSRKISYIFPRQA